MIKNRKLILVFSVFILLGAIHQIKFSVTPLKDIPLMLASMRAKEFCSCYYMLGKGKKYCLESVLKGYPQFEFTLIEKSKKVIFKNPIASASAYVLNERLGCTLR
jgi:hypothetical protein